MLCNPAVLLSMADAFIFLMPTIWCGLHCYSHKTTNRTSWVSIYIILKWRPWRYCRYKRKVVNNAKKEYICQQNNLFSNFLTIVYHGSLFSLSNYSWQGHKNIFKHWILQRAFLAQLMEIFFPVQAWLLRVAFILNFSKVVSCIMVTTTDLEQIK